VIHSTKKENGAVSPAGCREVMGLFVTGVTVVSARVPATGEVRGMTANGFMSVSLDPPLVLVSIRRGAHLHSIVEQAGNYGVSLLGERMEREARRFAGMSVAAHEPDPVFDQHAGAPVLRDALGWVVAAVVEAHRAGDHTLFIGEILELESGHPSQRPLGFYRSSFAEVTVLPHRGPIPIEPWDHPLTELWG
jgi:flavin reductase (DIM6/NTAB) family NADH-FMN oxidoreductase RutF